MPGHQKKKRIYLLSASAAANAALAYGCIVFFRGTSDVASTADSIQSAKVVQQQPKPLVMPRGPVASREAPPESMNGRAARDADHGSPRWIEIQVVRALTKPQLSGFSWEGKLGANVKERLGITEIQAAALESLAASLIAEIRQVEKLFARVESEEGGLRIVEVPGGLAEVEHRIDRLTEGCESILGKDTAEKLVAIALCEPVFGLQRFGKRIALAADEKGEWTPAGISIMREDQLVYRGASESILQGYTFLK